uniref:Uncharacterized protein n=1 Tax=Nomascus leucogenys TaxID=61853 RepID=A0A2I3HWI9_NOMLE
MLNNKQCRFTMRNRVNICSPVTNPNPEQISARQPRWVQSSEPESKQLL